MPPEKRQDILAGILFVTLVLVGIIFFSAEAKVRDTMPYSVRFIGVAQMYVDDKDRLYVCGRHTEIQGAHGCARVQEKTDVCTKINFGMLCDK